MSQADAVAVIASSVVVLGLLMFTDPRDALGYLLAYPIWLVAKDLGPGAGAAAGAGALLSVVAWSSAQDIVFGPLGYLSYAAVFFGSVAAGTRAAQPELDGQTEETPTLPVLTKRPEVSQKTEPLSRRELQVLDLISTGANNAQIAARFFISQNTVKSHVSRILQKLPAANRTEAAFRYRELYGPPAPISGPIPGDAGDPGERATLTAASALTATVAALHRFYGVLNLQDGRELEVPLLEQIRKHVEVGATAIVYFDHCDRAMGWYLPDQEVGVDLRAWAR